MIPVYCITVPQLAYRKDELAAEAEELGIPITWWEGLHGRTAGIWALYRDSPKALSPGHTALCINHWFLWQHALLQGHEWIVVCEDDVRFPEDFLFKVNSVIAEVQPIGVELVYLGWLRKFQRETSKLTRSTSRIIGAPPNDYPYGTHCMLIHRNALPVLMETNRVIDHHSDIAFGTNSLPKLNWAVCTPPIVDQKTGAGKWPSATSEKTENLNKLFQ